MTCPICGEKAMIIKNYVSENGDSVRRRRKCRECGYRFSTMEVDKDYWEKLVKIREKITELERILKDVKA